MFLLKRFFLSFSFRAVCSSLKVMHWSRPSCQRKMDCQYQKYRQVPRRPLSGPFSSQDLKITHTALLSELLPQAGCPGGPQCTSDGDGGGEVRGQGSSRGPSYHTLICIPHLRLCCLLGLRGSVRAREREGERESVHLTLCHWLARTPACTFCFWSCLAGLERLLDRLQLSPGEEHKLHKLHLL